MPTLTRGLDGQVALVTGGAVRVGRAISVALAEHGAAVAIHCHSHRAEAESLATELRAGGAAVCVVQGDLSEPAVSRRIFDEVAGLLGEVGILVNNAGLIDETPLASFDPALAQRLVHVNALAPLYTMAELARRAAAAAQDEGGPASSPGGRQVVNVVDTSVERPWPKHAAYCASKAALLAASEVAAKELAPAIRVNVVNPGTVELRPEEVPREHKLRAHIPLDRIGRPEDIAHAVLYLLEAPYVTGAVLAVDGGARLR